MLASSGKFNTLSLSPSLAPPFGYYIATSQTREETPSSLQTGTILFMVTCFGATTIRYRRSQPHADIEAKIGLRCENTI